MKINRIIDCITEVKMLFPEFDDYSVEDVNDYTMQFKTTGLDGKQYTFNVAWSNNHGGWMDDFDQRYPEYYESEIDISESN